MSGGSLVDFVLACVAPASSERFVGCASTQSPLQNPEVLVAVVQTVMAVLAPGIGLLEGPGSMVEASRGDTCPAASCVTWTAFACFAETPAIQRAAAWLASA